MMLFWTLTAAMIVAALTIIAPTLLRKQRSDSLDRDAQNIAIARERLAELDAELKKGEISAEEHANTKVELEQVLLQDLEAVGAAQPESATNIRGYRKIALVAILVLVPLVSVALYQTLGTPDLITTRSTAPTTTGHGNMATAGSMADLAIKLRQRLEKETPDDANGWFLLGRTYMSIKDYPQATQAFDRAYQLLGDQTGVMLALADALTMSQQGNTAGRPAELVAKALAIEPENPTALWMSALIAEDRGDFKEALRLMEKLHPLLADEPQEQQQLAMQIARISARAGIEPPALAATVPASQVTGTQEPSTTTAAEVRLKVSLSSAFQQKADANETVFIYAKAMNGPRFPLAAARYRVSDLPLEITLNDSMAMMPAAKLSDFSVVKVGARISSSGNAISQSGDLFGERQNIKVGDGEVIDIVIDTVQP